MTEVEHASSRWKIICNIFCCPPLPSKIIDKIAFFPRSGASYSLTPPADRRASDAADGIRVTATGEQQMTLQLLEKAEWIFSDRELSVLEAFTCVTSRSETIACIFVRTQHAAESRFTILHSHANACDIGQMCSLLVFLSFQLNCNILTYDYSGYGVSTGKPSEQNLYADIDAAFKCLTERYSVSPSSVILYGQSIGTVPTIDLASRQPVAGVVLHAAFMSALRVAFPDTKRTWFFDSFPNIDKVESIESPVLVIHGLDDADIDISHGKSLFARCPHAVEPLWVPGAGHNDIEEHEEYLERLIKFITVDLRK